ncbi:MAG: hypothetical protein ACFB9N_18045 [Geitlerinemataceae cyanobacterium]
MQLSPIARHGLLLALWTAIGLAFRTIDLTALPPWTDECATIAFSSGNGFLDVPLDRPISTAELTAPMWLAPDSSLGDVWRYLMSESTHPPLYFFLAHLWMKLFAPAEGFSWESREQLLWAARSLPAILGAASVPAMFGLARVAFGRSAMAIAHLSAALMAVSPFAVSLGREARHYTLVLLFVIGSFACTLAIVKALAATLRQGEVPGEQRLWAIALAWGTVNAAGMATHYFFGLTLAIEAAVVLGAIGLWRLRPGRWIARRGWLWLTVAAVPTVLGAIVWIPLWRDLGETSLTDWVQDGSPGLDALFRLLSWWVAMFFALPTDDLSVPLGWLVVNGLVLLTLFVAGCRWVAIGLRSFPVMSRQRSGLQATVALAGCGIAAILTVTFALQSDLTLAIRFSYPYFPAVILLAAAGLGGLWQQGRTRPIAIVLAAGFLGATATAFDLTYLQHHRADRMAEVIFERADRPVLVATVHKHHGQTGRAIGVAWELGRLADSARAAGEATLNFDDPDSADARYLLVSRSNTDGSNESPTVEAPTRAGGVLRESVMSKQGRPLEVWPINFRDDIEWAGTGCIEDDRDRPDVREYNYLRFVCPAAGANDNAQSATQRSTGHPSSRV